MSPHPLLRRQVFNEFNSRSLTDDWDVYSRWHGSGSFYAIIVVEVGMQVRDGGRGWYVSV